MSSFENQNIADLQRPFSSDDVILSVKDLTVRFYTRRGIVEALRGVSFDLKKQQVLGIVGESGSGKSVLALSLLNLIEEPGRILKGEVVFKGHDLLKLNRRDMNKIRGGQISMIFSDPMSAFDPTLTVGSQIVETIRRHHDGISKSKAREMAVELFKNVKIPSPHRRFDEFPSMFSGGMIQRAMIADALSSDPEFIIADNPTQALDVTIQAQILELIAELRTSQGTTIILITNSLPILARYADEIMVLYAGSVLEHGEKHAVLKSPSHPYTMGLIESIPSVTGKRLKRLKTIRGFTPDRLQTEITSTSCLFADRCSMAMDVCFTDSPDAALVSGSGVHFAKCFRASELQQLSAY
jgi:oligopeptide/dipeptide ABC transporter ATP-binding protein